MNGSGSDRKCKIIFYDGDCGVCNNFVLFVLKRNKEDFLFAPLESELFQIVSRQNDVPNNLDSIVLFDGQQMWIYSDAIAHILQSFNFLFKVIGKIILILPKFISFNAYKFFAKNRHRFKKKMCPMPSRELKLKMIYTEKEFKKISGEN